MKNYFFYILALLCLCASTQYTVAQNNSSATDQNKVDYGFPKEYEVGGITVSGTQYLDQAILVSLSGLAIGDKITIPGDDISTAIKTLWKQGLFADVQIYASRIVNDIIFLELKLKELPRLAKYKFEGVKNVELEELRESLPLLAGRILDDNTKNNTVYSVKNYYINKGYLNTVINLKEVADTNRANSVILTIDVQRGKRVKINELVLEGVEQVYPRKLKKVMKETKAKSNFNPKAPKMIWDDLRGNNVINTLANVSISDALNYFDDKIRIRLFSSSKFLKKKYKDDKEAIIAYYNSEGYRDARIIEDTTYFVDETNLNVHLKIDEGKRYYFGDIDWSGNTKYEKEQLARILNIKKGEIYNSDLLTMRLYADPNGADVSSLYMNDGYLFFNVTPIEKRVDSDTIDLEMRVYEGPEATINRILISGNTKTNEHVIRRAIRTQPGSKFRRSDIIRSQRELAALNYFNPETIGIQPRPNPSDGTVDIEYTVEERPSDQLELSLGWGGQGAGSLIGSVGVSFNNFSIRNMFNRESWKERGLPAGDGQQLSVRFQSNGRAYQALSGSFTEPWLGGKRPNSFTLSVARVRQAQYPRNNNAISFDFSQPPTNLLTNNTVGLSLGRRLKWPDDNFTMINSLRLSHYELIAWDQRFIVKDGNYFNLSLSTTISRSTIDQPIYPRSGSNFSFSLEVTPPYSQFNNKDYSSLSDPEKYKFPEYHKWKFKAEWYTALTRDEKLVLMASTKVGVLGYYNEAIGTAPFERFWIGGDGLANQVGGFLAGTDIFALRGYDDNDITRNSYLREDGNTVQVGDPFLSKVTLELRYLLSPNPSATIYGLAFLEGGNSWSNMTEYNPFNLNRSAGLGVRIFLPMFGLMGFDYGVGFDKNAISDGTFGGYLSNYAKFSFILGFNPE